MGISYSKNSNNSIVENEQLSNWISLHPVAILSGYWEYYPSRVNYATFLVNSMSLEISSNTTLQTSCIWVEKFYPLTLSEKKYKAELSWEKIKVFSSFDRRMSLWRQNFVSEAYLEHSWTSMIGLFAKIVNS